MSSSDRPTATRLSLRSLGARFTLPAETVILGPEEADPLPDVQRALRGALAAPIGSRSLSAICAGKLRENQNASAVIVVSDNTRPVPYTGPSGVLWPIVRELLDAGFFSTNVTVLVASGTHRPPTAGEMEAMFDERVIRSGVSIECHDAFVSGSLDRVGRTSGGIDVLMNRVYADADLKILTGLVESHFMAGTSGGRKSICPGLLGISSIREFHGPMVLSDSLARDLNLAGNPCHQLALEVARMVPADFIVNVTARDDGAVVGVFAGDMEKAHAAASEHVRSFAEFPFRGEYDIVVTHAGEVGVNHYQACKAASIAAKVVKEGGYVIVVADTPDPDPIGSECYRALMVLLKSIGPKAFECLIRSPDWTFVPDQWQAQMWARVFRRIPWANFLYFSPQTAPRDYCALPCADVSGLRACLGDLDPARQVGVFVEEAVDLAYRESLSRAGATPTVAYLPAGPSGIPAKKT